MFPGVCIYAFNISYHNIITALGTWCHIMNWCPNNVIILAAAKYTRLFAGHIVVYTCRAVCKYIWHVLHPQINPTFQQKQIIVSGRSVGQPISNRNTGRRFGTGMKSLFLNLFSHSRRLPARLTCGTYTIDWNTLIYDTRSNYDSSQRNECWSDPTGRSQIIPERILSMIAKYIACKHLIAM